EFEDRHGAYVNSVTIDGPGGSSVTLTSSGNPAAEAAAETNTLPTPIWMLRSMGKVRSLSITNNNVNQSSGGNNIIYQRTTETDQSTTGSFSIPGTKISGYILEPAGPSTTQSGLDRRIPAGTYNIIKNVGSKYGLRLYNDQVPQSRAILMHIGNYPGDTEGCLLSGSSIGVNFVSGSGSLINQIMNHFNQVGFNGATITILDINRP
ncbi:MAG TPA: hypothetical protein DCG75_06305, partial [Bacteroidales bacterium]|nr:hypothetical protein [Bacteroidales bacterium]